MGATLEALRKLKLGWHKGWVPQLERRRRLGARGFRGRVEAAASLVRFQSLGRSCDLLRAAVLSMLYAQTRRTCGPRAAGAFFSRVRTPGDVSVDWGLEMSGNSSMLVPAAGALKLHEDMWMMRQV